MLTDGLHPNLTNAYQACYYVCMTVSDDYLAGLFDGEGWLSIRRATASTTGGLREWQHQCSVHLCIREQHLAQLYADRFGGKLYLKKPRQIQHSIAHEWIGYGYTALQFATEMQDILVAKRPQAKLIIDFQNAKKLQGPRAVKDEQYEFYERCYDTMKQLNMKGIGKQNSNGRVAP